MRLFLFAMLVSAVLVASVAFSGEAQFDSMEGRTQLDVAGYMNLSTDSNVTWLAQTSGFHYLAPHFGVGGIAALGGGSGAGSNYMLAPGVEYFVPVADRSHLFVQGLAGLTSFESGSSYFNLTGVGGYRYFVSDDIAFSAKLSKSWVKANDAGGSLNSTGGLNLLLGFSVFF